MKSIPRRWLIPLALALGACDFQASTAGGSTGEVGAAVDRTQQELAEAGEKTREALSEAGAKLEPKLEAAGEKLEAAAERITDAAGQVTTTVTTGERSRAEAAPANPAR